MTTSIRAATVEDVPRIRAFIEGLADYEQLRHACVATNERLRDTLFGEHPFAEVVIAECDRVACGFALFFHNYSTFLAQPGIYLEDLFVVPTHRGRGVGKVLLQHLAALATARGCGRLEWSVLNWNADAIAFYERLGAQAQEDWTVYRVTGTALSTLASGEG